MKIKHYAILSFLVLLLGCANRDDQLNDFISNTFPDLKSGEILVLPGSGCSGCISDAENSIDSLLKIQDYKIIFSRIQSLKTLKNRLAEKHISVNDPDIFLDTADLYVKNAEKYKEIWSYPTRIIIKDKSVIKVAKL